MYVLVKDFLAEHAAITSRWTAFGGFYAELVGYVEEIFVVSGKQESDIRGAAMEKADAKEKLCGKVLVVSEKSMGYATVEEDEAFLSLIKFTKSKTERMTDATLLAKARGLYTNVLPKLGVLGDYDLEAGELEALRELTEAFETIYTRPESQIKERKALTARLREIFVLTDEVLRIVDAMVKTARVREPDFVAGYKLRRILPKLAYRRRALELWVADEASGEPVGRARVVIARKDGAGKPIRRKTGKKGGIVMNNLEAGEYVYEISFGGYVVAKGVFFVNRGEMTRVRVELVRSG